MATEAKNVISQILSDIWWLVLLRGITATLLGILLFTQTGVTLMVFMLFVGAYWFVHGIFTIFASIKGRKYLDNWGWGIFTGIISLLAGLNVADELLRGQRVSDAGSDSVEVERITERLIDTIDRSLTED